MWTMRVVFDLGVSARAPAEARAVVHRLNSDLDPDTCYDLRLVISELVANAVKYGPGRSIHVEIEVDGRDRVRGGVTDGGAGPLEIPHIVARPGPAGGYGMRVVDAVTSCWGVREGSTGVWFELGG
jgi:two-component sensor histidine kinase